MRRATFLLLAVVLATGCGGGGSGKPLTRDQYAAKANAICGKYTRQTKALAHPTNLSDLADVVGKTLPILDHAISDLHKLKPPADERSTVDQWLAQVANLRSDLQEIRDKAKTNDVQGVKAVVPRATQDNKQSNQLATQLGLKVCSQD